jgi:UDP-2,3-diacylglucosamine pyrophosphatase LpxH
MRKRTVLRYRTVVLSDVHLGTAHCKIREVNDLLKHTESEKLILNGDIVDGWSLLRRGGWQKGHTRFVRLVLKKAQKRRTEVIYLRGNHDDLLARVLPIRLDRLRIAEEHIHESPRGRYLVVHGDVFDMITTQHRFLAVLGDIGYQTLLRLNRLYNRYRTWRGREYFSLSKAVKARVKNAVNYIGRFEERLQSLARTRGCQGIICGHIHSAANKRVGEIHYLNSGDWVESMTALVEHEDGRWEVLTYPEFRRRLLARASERSLRRNGRHLEPVPVLAAG